MGMDHEYELRVTRPAESLSGAHLLRTDGRQVSTRPCRYAAASSVGYAGRAADALPGDDVACPRLDLLRGGAVAPEGRALPPAPGAGMTRTRGPAARPRAREPRVAAGCSRSTRAAAPTSSAIPRTGCAPRSRCTRRASGRRCSSRQRRARPQLCRRLVGHRRPGRAHADLRALVRPARPGAAQDLAAAAPVPGRVPPCRATAPCARAATPRRTTTSGTTSTGCSSTSR